MKNLGIVRKIDSIGRLVLPVELRRTMDLNCEDSVEIFIDKNNIILKKYIAGCTSCGNLEKLKEFNGIRLCNDCLKKFNK